MNKVQLTNLTFLITVIIYIAGGNALGIIFKDNISMFANVLISEAMILVPAILYMVATRQNLIAAVRVRKIRWATFFLLPVFTACIMPFMTFLNSISLLFTTNTVLSMSDQVLGVYNYPVALIIMAVMPAVAEEICYRGIFYNEYRKVSSLGAVLLSGLLFGLMHMNLNQFVYAFGMGVVFAIVVEATGSLVSSFIVHFCINAFSTTLLYVMPKVEAFSAGVNELREQSVSQMSEWVNVGELSDVFGLSELASATTVTPKLVLLLGISCIPTTVAAAALIFAFTKLQGTGKEVAGIFKREKKQNLFSIPLVAGIVLCVGYITLRLLIEYKIVTL